MIITCQNCECRFRVGDSKVPAGSFTVSCPKCQTTTSATNVIDVRETSAMAVGKSPSTTNPRFQPSRPAPLFRIGPSEVPELNETAPQGNSANELAMSLLTLLKPEKTDRTALVRPSWDRRRVLVCTAPEHREQIGRGLTQENYEVFVAEDTQQAVERMRESHLDVVILDQAFDPVDQGAAFVNREVSVLRPAQRRRIFFMMLSISKRTMDAHAAFLQNVNAIINFNELYELPEILDRAIREYNELYKDFNVACGVAPL
ncbi:MAG TPA: zinc-ribbon domain-containing protein [Pyrinomonadaceae bacterium]|nr:zinc-ribbon domain-containing protein [Pyrinomonadaceae bacterium]